MMTCSLKVCDIRRRGEQTVSAGPQWRGGGGGGAASHAQCPGKIKLQRDGEII